MFGSKYTDSGPETAFLSRFARCSHSCFVTFLFREVDAEEREWDRWEVRAGAAKQKWESEFERWDGISG